MTVIYNLQSNNGQSLIEVLIGMVISAILIGAAATSAVFVLRSNYDVKTTQIAASLASDYSDNIKSLAFSNWQNIYNPPADKGANSQFYLTASGTTFILVSGATTTMIEGKNFTRYFSIENVSRDLCGMGDISTNATTTCAAIGDTGIADDPSMQKITISVNWEGGRSLNKIQYLARGQNKVFIQTNWSGGANQEYFSTSSNNTFVNNKFTDSSGIDFSNVGSITISDLGGESGSSATGTIDSTYKYAWGENIGWVDFGTTEGNVIVSNSELTGYAWNENTGWISLNCSNTNSCGAVDYKVSNDGSGNLSGYAWAENGGWVNFGPFTNSVIINGSTGDFYGWAWSENIGWISFNCDQSSYGGSNVCSTSDYKVKTSALAATSTSGWLESSIYDTWAVGGSAINTIMWQGDQPSGTSVKFQIASSNNLNGPWDYKGSDGSSSTYYEPAGSNIPSQINLAYHNNQRYFRYKIFLYSDTSGLSSPTINDVIINWSP